MPIDWTLPLILSLAFDTLIRVGLGIRIILRRRAVSVSLAWLAVLLFAPLVGTILYLLVGEVWLGRSRVRRRIRVVRRLQPRLDRLWKERPPDNETATLDPAHLDRVATAVTGIPPVGGNRLTLSAGSRDFIDAAIADIEIATTNVHICFYIWMTGHAGDDVAEALIRAAARGVVCRVLVDGYGSRPFLRSQVARRLRDAGVDVVTSLPANLLRALLHRIDVRNHRKCIIVDGRIAWTGSQNLTDEHFRVSRRPGVGPWVDAMVRIEGPAVRAIQIVFVCDWLLEARESPRELTQDETVFPPPHPVELPGTTVQVIPSGPGEGSGAATIRDLLASAIHTASDRLVLTTPYFVPDEATRVALCSAALRGVETRLVVPKQIDAPLVAFAMRSEYEALLAAGVHVHQFTDGLLHAKTLTVDDRVAFVGSVNMDMRSFWLNFETTIYIRDDDVASHLLWLQQSYLEASEVINPETWAARSRAVRLVESTARLFGPLL